MDRPHRSDRSTRALVRLRDWTAARRHRQDRESGQATVEFALILFPLLILVVGIIQFGIGLNYWLDMQRIANQGARWAAVNNWPRLCPRARRLNYTCNSTPPTCAAALAERDPGNCCSARRFTARLGTTATVTICYPGETSATIEVGDPVRVKLDRTVQVLRS